MPPCKPQTQLQIARCMCPGRPSIKLASSACISLAYLPWPRLLLQLLFSAACVTCQRQCQQLPPHQPQPQPQHLLLRLGWLLQGCVRSPLSVLPLPVLAAHVWCRGFCAPWPTRSLGQQFPAARVTAAAFADTIARRTLTSCSCICIAHAANRHQQAVKCWPVYLIPPAARACQNGQRYSHLQPSYTTPLCVVLQPLPGCAGFPLVACNSHPALM